MFNLEYIQQLTEKKSKIFDDMSNFPEREQELAEEYFSIEQEITNHYKNIPTNLQKREGEI